MTGSGGGGAAAAAPAPAAARPFCFCGWAQHHDVVGAVIGQWVDQVHNVVVCTGCRGNWVVGTC